MALIKCPECGLEVSDRASACPKCACPIGRGQLIEQTGKQWKVIQLLGFLVCIVGVVVSCGSLGAENTFKLPGFLILLAGLIVFMLGRFGAWWHHG